MYKVFVQSLKTINEIGNITMRTLKSTFSLLVILVTAVPLLLAGCASTQTEKLASKEQFSGYLSNYTDLKEVKTEKDLEFLRWISPDVKPGEYTKVYQHDIAFYPKLTPEQLASRDTLMQIGDYFNQAIKRELAQNGVLATGPGPGVAETQLAITGVYISNEGMKAYEIVPVAAVIGLGETAMGKRDQIVQLVVEGKMTDSESGKLLANAVYKGLGKNLKNDKTQLTLDDVKPVLDTWAKNMATQIQKLLIQKK